MTIRIALTGFGTESSTFSRHRMRREEFRVVRGADLVTQYRLDRDDAAFADVEWVPLVTAKAGAGGPMDPADFDAIVAEIVDGLAAAGPLDGIYLDLHGAAHVDGRDHAEEFLLRAIRTVVGDDIVISASMDTHGNFSRELAEMLDLAVCYRHAPHIDRVEIKDRAVRNLLTVVRAGVVPAKAWVRVPVLLPGERTATNVEPGRTVFRSIVPTLEKHGVLDASLWVGFAWADEDRNAAAVMVTGYDTESIVACAHEIAQTYWDARRDFTIVSERYGSMDEALDYAMTAPPAPLFISDSGDNVTGGGSGDVTYALSRALERDDVMTSGRRVLFPGLVDPSAVEDAIAAGVGGVLDRPIGAWMDDRFAAPVQRPWTVTGFITGLYDGEGITAALLEFGPITVVVQRSRSYFVNPADPAFAQRRLPGHAYLPSDGFDIVVVKNGYLFPGQEDEAASSFMAITPGGTDLDDDRLEFHRVMRPVWPLDSDFVADLEPSILSFVRPLARKDRVS